MRRLPSLAQRAFSILEAATAIALVAFSLVGLFALLPAGLGGLRAAIDISVGAQIAQRVAGDLQEGSFSAILKNCTPDLSIEADGPQMGVLPSRFFDEQGNEIRPRGGAAPSLEERVGVLYEVKVRVTLSGETRPQGAEPLVSFSSRNLATLAIQVAYNPGGAPLSLKPDLLIDDPKRTFRLQIFPAVIARSSPHPQP